MDAWLAWLDAGLRQAVAQRDVADVAPAQPA
jgi:hypothetical protein